MRPRRRSDRAFPDGARVKIISGVRTGHFGRVLDADWRVSSQQWSYRIQFEDKAAYPNIIAKREPRLQFSDPDLEMAEGL